MGVSPVQFPKSHLVVFSPLRIKPSLHWYKPVPPCRVFGTYNCTSMKMMMMADQDRHIIVLLPTTSNWMCTTLDWHASRKKKWHLLTTTIPLLGGAKMFDLDILFLKVNESITYLARFCSGLREIKVIFVRMELLIKSTTIPGSHLGIRSKVPLLQVICVTLPSSSKFRVHWILMFSPCITELR